VIRALNTNSVVITEGYTRRHTSVNILFWKPDIELLTVDQDKQVDLSRCDTQTLYYNKCLTTNVVTGTVRKLGT
jgi:hypothetical protein